MSKNIVVAIVGMSGSGKTEVTKIFLENGYQRVYFGDVTFDEMKRQGLAPTQDNERKVREELRASGDKAIYAKMLMPKIQEAYKNGNVLLESLYSWSEYEYVKKMFNGRFFVVAAVTNRAVRASRISVRPDRPLTDEQLTLRDKTQIEFLDQGGPIGIADYYIINNGSFEALREQTEIIKGILKNISKGK